MLEDSIKYWEKGLAFNFISKCQNARGETPQYQSGTTKLISATGKQEKSLNLKKLQKYKNNPCNIGKWDCHSTMFQGLEIPCAEYHISIYVKKATIWSLELGKEVHRIWKSYQNKHLWYWDMEVSFYNIPRAQNYSPRVTHLIKSLIATV